MITDSPYTGAYPCLEQRRDVWREIARYVRRDAPEVGTLVTFRFQELTKAGVPRFPSFVAQRVDISWEQVEWLMW